jgi:hypothetical protein
LGQNASISFMDRKFQQLNCSFSPNGFDVDFIPAELVETGGIQKWIFTLSPVKDLTNARYNIQCYAVDADGMKLVSSIRQIVMQDDVSGLMGSDRCDFAATAISSEYYVTRYLEIFGESKLDSISFDVLDHLNPQDSIISKEALSKETLLKEASLKVAQQASPIIQISEMPYAYQILNSDGSLNDSTMKLSGVSATLRIDAASAKNMFVVRRANKDLKYGCLMVVDGLRPGYALVVNNLGQGFVFSQTGVLLGQTYDVSKFMDSNFIRSYVDDGLKISISSD